VKAEPLAGPAVETIDPNGPWRTGRGSCEP